MRKTPKMKGGEGMDLAWALTIVGLCVIIALFIYALFGTNESRTSNYYYYSTPSVPPQRRYVERFATGGDDASCSGADYKLLFFQMEQCPHCVRFRPEWNKCVQQVSSMPKVCAVEVAATDAKKVKDYDVDGFPTIILEDVRNGNRMTYDGARTADAVVAFISQKAT